MNTLKSVDSVGAGILSAIGNTPLVQLKKVVRDDDLAVFAKLEALNPGGSIKDRSAFNIIDKALRSGDIGPDTVIIESSSGNMGVGLAQACSYFGLRFICVVDAKTTLQNIRLMEAYGCEVELISEPDCLTGEFLQARIDQVKKLLSSIKNSYWPNQYSNLDNSSAHHQTMREVATSLNAKVDYLFCATSTCGTLRGCAEYVRERNMLTKIYAVDAVGSVIFGGQKAKRLIPGHGAALIPPLYQTNLADEFVQVTDLDCIVGCRRLARQEAILVGGSSGAVLMAFEQVKHQLKPESNCVLVFADRGERYLDTIYSNAWVKQHFGEIPEPWEIIAEETCLTATY
jgi:N-(2-amino-2-carboxyethyl)-L-glutamate synthase